MAFLKSPITAIQHRPWLGFWGVGLLATMIVVLALDPAGDYPAQWQGPGLTVDEIFNVKQGIDVADPLFSGNFPKAIEAAKQLPDHPPFGRLWLGLAHELNLLVHSPVGEHDRIVIACARTGSAVAFGMLVFLISLTTARWHGNWAGYAAGISILLMPRVFGHAHIAALETVLNLTYAAAILSVTEWWKPTSVDARSDLPRWRFVIVAGLVMGLALLTKIQAIFLPLPVLLWALFNWGWRAFPRLIVWGLTGVTVFFVGWPWLWSAPIDHLRKYLGHAADRATIYVWYFGLQYADKDVPWHYPWVLTLATLPLGLLILSLMGLISRTPLTDESLTERNTAPSVRRWMAWLRSREALVLAAILLPLCVFSLPGIAVYDGERLFLMVFPLLGIFIGRGVAIAIHATQIFPRGPLIAGGVCGTLLFLEALSMYSIAPCWISSYSTVVGGMSGAHRLGLQTSYWGEGVNRDFLNQIAGSVPVGTTIDFLPVQHPFQLAALTSQCPAFHARKITLSPFDEKSANPAPYLITFSRQDYWPAEWRDSEPIPYTRILDVQRQGVILAGFYARKKVVTR